MPSKNKAERRETSLDYFAMSLNCEHSAYNLMTTEAHTMLWESTRDSVVRPVGMHGYSGLSCNGLAVMYSPERCLIRLSGGATGEGVARLWHQDTTISRVDVQSTVWFSGEPNPIIREAARHAQYAIDEGKTRVKSLREITSNDGGYTLYVGSRTSDVFLRMYNKYVESGGDRHYKGAVRYEVELKGAVAQSVGYQLASVIQEERAENEHIRVRMHATVYKTYLDRGIKVPFASEDGAYSLQAPRKRSDVQQKLNWLERSVKPSVYWLMERGLLSEALDSLGLSFLKPCIDNMHERD